MKKLLSLILVIMLCVCVLASCDAVDTVKGWFGDNTNEPGDNTPPEDENPPVEDGEPTLEDAKVVLRDLYKNKSTTTAGDFDVVGTVMVDTTMFTVTWKTDNANIQVVPSETEGNYTVDIIPTEPEADINYVLTATITAADGSSIETTFRYTVPKFAVNTYEQYIAAEDGDALVVEGVIYGIMSKAVDDKENSVFVQDPNGGGYYVYALSDDAMTSLQIGQTVRVRGLKKTYNGTPEVVEATIEVKDVELTTVTPVDLTEVYTAANTADAATLLAHLGEYVTIKGVTILGVDPTNDSYYCFELDGVKTYLRISSSSNCSTKAEQTTIINNHSKYFYYTADVTGTAAIYGGKLYIMPVDGNAFSNFSAEQLPLPDDVKAGMVKDALSLPAEFVTANPYTLPATGTGTTFADVTIAWALAETENATLVDGVLTPVIPAEGSVNITLTATITKGEAVLTKEFTVAVTKPSMTSIPDANEIAAGKAHNTYTTEKYFVEALIQSITKEEYGNMVIVDEQGNTLTIYGTYGDEAGTIKFGNIEGAKPGVGDKVVLYGVLGTYSGTNQMKNAWLFSWEDLVEDDNGSGDNGSDNTEATEMTITEVLAAAEGTAVKVTGTVESFYYNWDDTYGNCSVYIVDDAGNKLLAFRLATKVAVGDNITVTGNVTAYNGTNQIAAGCTAVINSSNAGGETTTVTTIPDALAAADGVAVSLRGIVIIADTWNTQFNNMSVTIKDAEGNTIYVYRLGTQVGLGDEITVTGQVGSYNDAKQIAQGATAEIHVVHGNNHTYENGKCTVCESAQPVAGTKVQACDFSTLSAGTQYADESNTFGDVVISTHNKGCHFNTQLRIYASDTNNGYAVVKATGAISSLVINAGYKSATLEVYGSTDGVTWVKIQDVATSTSYANHTVDIDPSLGYTYVKLDATGAQIRVASISVTYAN